MVKNTKSKWKKILGIVATCIIASGALVGMGFGAYNISQKTNSTSDFTDGRSIQINLRLYQTDQSGNFILDKNNQPIKIYSDPNLELEYIKQSAKYLTALLEEKGLVNISVSYGYSHAKNEATNVFANNQEPIAVLYANFENSATAFNLYNVNESVNEFYNQKQVYDNLDNQWAYEIELVKPTYNSKTYPIETHPNTYRTNNSGIFSDGKGYSGSDLSYYDIYLLKNEEVNPFYDNDGNEVDGAVSYTLKDDLTFKYFNSYQFGEQYKEFKELEKNETSSDDSTIATETQKYQTEYTWFLWKDKQGAIDYLNSLIGLWYFNLYANIVNQNACSSTDKDTILSNLFPTGSDPAYIHNAVDKDTRNKINVIINSLSDIERSFIGFLVYEYGANPSVPSLDWHLDLITEDNLIPVIYNFFNNEIFSPTTVIDDTVSNDNTDGVSQSVLDGWSFLESTNTALASFLGDYYVGTIDYRNFNNYFLNPNPPEATEEDSDPIPEPFNVNQFKIITDFSSISAALTYLNDENYKFPIINNNLDSFVLNFPEIANEYKILNDKFKPQNGNNDKQEIITFANKFFVGQALFSQQFFVPPNIAQSYINNYNPLDIMLVILGAIIFLVGIFVSIRYRIPGLFAFIISGLVFVLSIILYNVFGYLYSFYSLLAAAIGTFLSFFVPSFLFRNIEKEVSEGSTLSAAILKSTKKYWKMSLDTHIMAILTSLSFLFFGLSGNKNFGAMLIISVFLSFILSGIIYFILLLFYVYVVQFDFNDWFISNRYYQRLQGFGKTDNKKIWMINRLSYFNKWNYSALIILILIGLVGVIFVTTHGPIFSIDFSASNILVINNFDQLGISQEDVVKALNINTIESHLYDNQLVIYTLNNLEINQVVEKLSTIVSSELSNKVYDNTLVTTLTSDYAIKIVKNTLICFSIAIGFCAIWSVLSLNIISVIPLALTQVLTTMILVGFVSLIAIPIDLNVIPAFSLIFIVSTCFSTSLISSVKSSWNRKMQISIVDLKALLNSIIGKININYLIVNGAIICFGIFGMAFTSSSLISAFGIILIGCGLILFFVNNSICVVLWFLFVLLRNLFDKELIKTKSTMPKHVHDYDDVNEQKIMGLNC